MINKINYFVSSCISWFSFWEYGTRIILLIMLCSCKSSAIHKLFLKSELLASTTNQNLNHKNISNLSSSLDEDRK